MGGLRLMVQTPTKTLTLEEFLQLPETKPASEYINGQIIQKPMPHGWLIASLLMVNSLQSSH